ncbi:Ion channel [Pirellulimonas nuda]|uniref:Ion channel n=1 Tax=Pirellulimonas nuda TaxID=2528009 RepID=A0A518DHR4_9BACT|nr:potassium channel family protein [Pirellulimonas nuda]QDU91020.1 Ion channel [Pirellulimonas nuda]
MALLLRRWRYLLLLVALFALLVVQPIASSLGVMQSLFDGLLVLVMAALAQDRVWRVVACLACVLAAALLLGGRWVAPSAEFASQASGHAIGAIFFVAVAVKIVQSIFASREVSVDSIFGAICGFLLLGVAFALTYAMIYEADPASFRTGEFSREQMQQPQFCRNVFVYYSFVTLTTVGYGDLAPISLPARTLSWVEAVTGQLYLAVLIAGLISALFAGASARDHRGG